MPADYVLLDIVLATENHAGTVKVMDTIERRFPLVFEDVEAQEDYARFVESDEYREWLRTRTGK